MPGMRLLSLAIVGVAVSGCAAAPVASAPPSTLPTDGEHSVTPVATASATESGAPSPTAEPRPLAWSRLDSGGPAAREDHTWTVDAAGETAYLFGGRDGATVFDDTWAFDLTDDAWTMLEPPEFPPARFGHEALWVEGTGLVVFAGQQGPDTFFNDLWAFQPESGTWVQLPAAGALPTPRYGSCAALGPDARLWISHGFTEEGARFSDTRAYHFATGSWTDETPTDGPRPVERCLHGCWWTDTGELALYAGQTTGLAALDDRWLLGDAGWSQVGGTLPPARNLYARGRHDAGTLVFGGEGVDRVPLDDLWLLGDGAQDARELEPSGDRPPGRAGAELIVDAGRGRAILFGGRDESGALDDAWELIGL